MLFAIEGNAIGSREGFARGWAASCVSRIRTQRAWTGRGRVQERADAWRQRERMHAPALARVQPQVQHRCITHARTWSAPGADKCGLGTCTLRVSSTPLNPKL